jgi:hypothetical protein
VLKKYKIKHTKNIINFNKTRTQIGYIRFKEIIILINIIELYKTSPKNCKFIIIYKAIRVNKSEPPPPFIIIPSVKVIKAWVTQELISEE